MQTMKTPIRVASLLPNDVYDQDTDGSAVDLRPSDNLAFDTALVIVDVGAITGTPDSVAIIIEESDSSTFASAVTAISGGESFTVEQNEVYTKEVKRSKRYIRARIDITGGTSPEAAISASAVLTDWAVPFNTV